MYSDPIVDHNLALAAFPKKEIGSLGVADRARLASPECLKFPKKEIGSPRVANWARLASPKGLGIPQ